jgi:hypothetical protein
MEPDRTVEEVLWLRHTRAIQGGCCHRFADYQACNCLERAIAFEGRMSKMSKTEKDIYYGVRND